MTEEWRDIAGYEGLYQISNYGIVKSVDRYVVTNNGMIKLYRGQPISIYSAGGQYYKVDLCKNGIKHKFYIHRLVADAFCCGKDGKEQVDHIDGNKHNNSAENLEWVDRKENMKRAWSVGLCETCRAASKRNVIVMNEKRRTRRNGKNVLAV